MCGHDRFGIKLVCMEDRKKDYLKVVGGKLWKNHLSLFVGKM